jgi:hypothetical protein
MSKIIKQSEFAKMCGLSSGNLRNYIKRGKVSIYEVIGEGNDKQVLIDPANPVNKTFLKERDLLKAKKSFEIHDEETNKQATPGKSKEDSFWLRTKQAELEYKQSRAEMAKIELEQKQGRLIPTEKVIPIIADFVQCYKTSFLQQTELLIRDSFNENELSNEVRTRACSKLIDIANNSSRIAIDSVKKSVLGIANEQKTSV